MASELASRLRIGLGLVLLVFGVGIQASKLDVGCGTGEAPGPVHANAEAGFKISPPPGWTDRVDDAEGSRIAPAVKPKDGFAWLIVTTRLLPQPDARVHLVQLADKPARGPVANVVWGDPTRLTLDSGLDAAEASISQSFRGVPVRGWVLAAVDASRLIQVAGVLPASRSEAEFDALREAMRSVRPY